MVVSKQKTGLGPVVELVVDRMLVFNDVYIQVTVSVDLLRDVVGLIVMNPNYRLCTPPL